MKHIFAMLLALVLILSGCARIPMGIQPEESAASAPEEATVSEGTTAETEATVSAQEAVGTFQGGVYENDLLGVTASFDSDWYIATAEERLQIMGATVDTLDDDALVESLEKNGTAMDLYAAQENSSNVNVMLEKIGFQSVLISEEMYVDITLEQLPKVMETLQVEDAKLEKISLTFAGETHPGISVSGIQSGMNFYEKMAVVKSGGYFGVITAACYNEDVTDDILGLFQAK